MLSFGNRVWKASYQMRREAVRVSGRVRVCLMAAGLLAGWAGAQTPPAQQPATPAKPAPAQPSNSNPFPEDTSGVPVMPTRTARPVSPTMLCTSAPADFWWSARRDSISVMARASTGRSRARMPRASSATSAVGRGAIERSAMRTFSRAFPGKVATGFPAGNATNMEEHFPEKWLPVFRQGPPPIALQRVHDYVRYSRNDAPMAAGQRPVP